MRYIQIIESEETDKADREEAEELFSLTKEWLDKHSDHLEVGYIDEYLTNSTALGGSWVLPAKYLKGSTNEKINA